MWRPQWLFALWLLFAAGIALAILGLAAVANVVSLRELLAAAEAWRLLHWTERLHGLFSHRVVQALELLAGLSGLLLLGLTGWQAWARRGPATPG